MPEQAPVLYARKPVSGRAWALPFVLLALLTLAFVVKDVPDVTTTSWVAPLGAFSPVLLIWLLG